jgi:hypothetical protein
MGFSDRCYDFLKIFSPKYLAKILAFLQKLLPVFVKKIGHNIGFREKRQFFSAGN